MGRCTGCAENPKCNKPNKGRSPKCLECQGNWLRSYKRDAATERRAKVKRKREVQREVGNENAVTRKQEPTALGAVPSVEDATGPRLRPDRPEPESARWTPALSAPVTPRTAPDVCEAVHGALHMVDTPATIPAIRLLVTTGEGARPRNCFVCAHPTLDDDTPCQVCVRRTAAVGTTAWASPAAGTHTGVYPQVIDAYDTMWMAAPADDGADDATTTGASTVLAYADDAVVVAAADASDLAATTLGGPMPIPSDGAVTVAVPAGAVPGTVLQIADPGPAAARGKRRRRRGRGGGITVPAASETLRKPTDSNMAQEAATKEAALPEGVGGQAGERVVGNLTGPRRRPSKRQRRDETQARVFKEPVISAVELTAEMVLKMRASKTDFGAPHSTGRPHQDYLVCTKPRGS